ncbi:MAG: hydroxymethylbilane synthase [Pirellulales bacterium]
MSNSPIVRIGTRASSLARWQADWVAGQLRARGVDVEMVLITTSGDRQQTESIGSIGAVGVFTKEIQRALLEDRIDLAVHSLKDLPTERISGLTLAAVPERESVSDCLLSRDGEKFDALAPKSRIGTGSMRRQAMLLHARGDLRMLDIRGNVETRIAKLEAGDYDAIVLAEAGLRRLGLEEKISQVLPKSIMLPAVGQGALGLETRADDSVTQGVLAPLDHAATHCSVLAERSLLYALRGGCMAPVAAWGRVDAGGELQFDAVVLGVDGRQRLAAFVAGDPREAEQLGHQAAEQLIADGADDLIAASRGN